jgi:ComF family protein
MSKLSASVMGYFLDLLFPIHCLGCGKNREDLPASARWICPDCLLKIMPREEQICPHCKEMSEGGKTHGACRGKCSLDGLWAGAYYDDLLERAIHDLKFKFIKDIACPLSELMIRSITEAQEYGDFQDMIFASYSKEEEEGIYADEDKNARLETVIVPVPLHERREKERGFNQSALIAGQVGNRFSITVREDILIRVKNTKPQSKTMGQEERWNNIKSAFSCVLPEEIKGKNVIVLDDICTTSATLEECAKELKRAGAGSVWGLVAARK